MSNLQSDSFYRRRVLAWSWYDWADHAYITTTASTFFPPYFVTLAAPAFMVTGPAVKEEAAKAIARSEASNLYAFTVSISLLVAALLAPLVGTYADITGQRKRLLIIITLLGGVLASAMFGLTTEVWYLGVIFYFITQVAVNIALGLNSSLLPHIARPDDMNRVSSLGYAMGYMGGWFIPGPLHGAFLVFRSLGDQSRVSHTYGLSLSRYLVDTIYASPHMGCTRATGHTFNFR
jgi:UMF1 family MFS transporter